MEKSGNSLVRNLSIAKREWYDPEPFAVQQLPASNQ